MRASTETILAELEAVNRSAAALCEGLNEHQLAWRPRPEKWSIAENLVHLRITTEAFLPVVDSAIAESRRREIFGTGLFNLGWYGRLLVWYVEPPPVIRLPAPKKLLPRLSGDPSHALDDFMGAQGMMVQRLASAADLDLTGLRFPSPLASYIRMNLLEFFSVFNGHSRRHMWQAVNVRGLLASGSGFAG
jgi:DinB superfamily